MKSLLSFLLVSFVLAVHTGTFAAETSKRVLVVTTTAGFRHASIPTAEKILTQLATQSGAFTVEFLHQPEGEPVAPKKPATLKTNATPDELAAFKAAEEKFAADQIAFKAARPAWDEKLKAALTKLSPELLKSYDGVIFASTSGDLPIPDKEGFLNWIRSGKAFIGIHAASDTFPHWPEFLEMLGGEFKTHGPQVGVEYLNVDPQHPANQSLGRTWTIQLEEIYQFKNYDPTNVHELLVMDKHPNTKVPGHFPVAWCRDYGQGKVFFTAIGHREDIWDSDPNLADRKNPVEISQAFQAHLLGGIKWALGIAPENNTAKNK